MKSLIYPSIFLVILLFSSNNSYGQGNTCDAATPFCTTSLIQYPAGTTGTAQVGPDYDCITFGRNAPAWFSLEIDNPGVIEMGLNTNPLEDIDYAIWGPFAPGSNVADICTQISTGTIPPADCSFLGGFTAPVETPEITGTMTGEIFVMVVINFSANPTDVTISQLSGTGSTNCNFTPPPPPAPVVPEYTPVLSGTAAYSKANLSWTRPIDTTGTLPPIEQFEVYITDDGGITYTLAALTREYSTSLDLLNGIEYGFRVRPMYVIQGSNNYLAGNYSNVVYLRPSIVLGTEGEGNSKISLYPNPSTGNFTLKFEDLVSQKATIKVTDLTGKTIFTQNLDAINGNSSHAISLPTTAAAGMYIIQVETEKGIYQQKISVTK